MQKFERGSEPPPPGLQTAHVQRSREVMREFMRFGHEKRGQTSAPLMQDVLRDPSLMDGLTRLFRGRCAFCEAIDVTHPHRFRPAAEALPFQRSDQGHLYYVWLADAWENIYPICKYCTPGEPNYFPVRGARAPLPTNDEIDRYVNERLGLWRAYPIRESYVLLDPCESKDFYRSFRPQWDGMLSALSPRGQETISTFNLNHPERVRQREARYAEYYERLIEALSVSVSRIGITELFDFPSLEFGGTWYILLRRLATSLNSKKGAMPILSPARIAGYYSSLYGEKRTEERLRKALAILREEDSRDPEIKPLSTVRRPGTARLREVQLTNYKAIERLTLSLPDEVPDLDSMRPVPSLLILGENATGKSSILEAIALTMVDDAARERFVPAAHSFVLDPSYMGAETSASPRLAEVMLTMVDGSRRALTIGEARMTAAEDPGFEPLPVFAYGAFRHYQGKKRVRAADGTIRNLFDGSLLGNPQAWLLSLNDASFAMVVRTLRGILSIDGEFEVIERDRATRNCSVVTATQNRNGESILTRTPLGAVSSGFRSVLAMACDVMQGLMDPNVYPGFETFSSARGIVLIDEVEAHLHPRWKMRIMSGLRHALPGMTFIATTHDPLCLRGMGAGEVSVLRRVASVGYQDPTELPVFVEQVVDLPNTEQLRIEQLLTSDFFQLFSTDEPIFEDRIAMVADLLAKRRESQLSPEEEMVVSKFQRDIADALPIGSSEAHRLVQEAVALFLKERRTASDARMRELRQSTRSQILQVLRGA